MTGEKPREIAARVLRQAQVATAPDSMDASRVPTGGLRDIEDGARAGQHSRHAPFVENLLEQALADSHLSSPDRRLCQELVYGVVRWRATLDWLIARKAQNAVQKKALQDLLRLGLYQIFFLDRIPNHAAVNETVAMAKRAGFGPQSGFVNAVLRGYIREFDATKAALAELKMARPYLGYSHPEWLVNRWRERWGVEKTGQLLAWNNTAPDTFARINTLKTDPGKLLVQWRDEDVDYDFVRGDWLEDNLVFKLKSHPPLERLASFRQGLFYVQDPSTLLAVRELDPHPAETILDLCAAPGGKLTYIAEVMRNEGHITGHDLSGERLKLVQENCARLGVTCVQVISEANRLKPASFDRILVDAPCSNTGVMRRRVELRWRIRPEELQRLGNVQIELLSQAGPLLKPTGVLVYSTCSLEPEENREIIDEFLKAHPAFKLEHDRELLPFFDRVDGAYVARMRRAK